MPAIVYDTGALLAAERHNPDFLALHDIGGRSGDTETDVAKNG